MAKPINRQLSLPLAALPLDSKSAVPLHRQLCDRLREAILAGQLVGGMRLPGTRTLAAELGISRNTVLNAFEQLLAEGYVEGKIGAGTYVACTLPEALLQVCGNTAEQRIPGDERRALSQRGQHIAMSIPIPPHPSGRPQPFQAGLPAVDMFPFPLWARLMARAWRNPPAALRGWGESAGYMPLRETIAAYLQNARGVRCSAEQVIITAGSQQALSIAAHVLLDPGDAAWVENPGYCGARGALLSASARLVPVPVDNEGLYLDEHLKQEPDGRLIYVTPSHQYPTGVVMSLNRRIALLEWAEQAGIWILEDDYDSEFRYVGRPLSALQGLDRSGRVIYIGSFSKVLLPTLRIGYLVVPPDLVSGFTRARGFIDWQSPLFDQVVLNDFITEGHFSHHIRRMRTLYAERQKALLDIAAQELDGLLEIHPGETGMTLMGWLPEGVDDRRVAHEAEQLGIIVRPLSLESIQPLQRGGLLLGYAAFDSTTMRESARHLATAIRYVAYANDTANFTPWKAHEHN